MIFMATQKPNCLYCERDSGEIPLIQIVFQDQQLWICPQHLPILIHKPEQLAGKLPGVENLGQPEGHDH
jgi:hypothetical protein